MVDDQVAGDRAVDEGLAEAFWGVARELKHRYRDSLEPWDITPGQARALGVLLGHGPLRISELSERLGIVPRSTTEVVDGLQERGLVRRSPDPGDRRAVLVELTEQGRSAGAAIRAARTGVAASFFADLAPADRADLARILRTLLTDRRS